MGIERRRDKRLFIKDASMICRDEQGNLVSVSKIRDLSRSGIGFYTRDNVDIGTEIRFQFALPEKKRNGDICGMGDVVWKISARDTFGDTLVRAGLRFKNLPSGSVTSITKYIKKSQDQMQQATG